MSRLTTVTKVHMKGFKSFAHKVEMVFGDGFNCVLGPNGSGKSNVMDALCFVLGKSSVKDMRAEKSANLIYNGGKSKNPAKEAEVSIYFDNTSKVFPLDSEEIKITRIIKSKAKRKKKEKTKDPDEEENVATQGIYKINDKVRTRQQILDLLSAAKINPNGYNIILQGDIVKLVEMPTTQRRLILEEISGISIYEEKKQKALRELEKVDTKLSEADIIMSERKTYLSELKKDRDQALKFKELDDKIKRNKATLLDFKIQTKQKHIERYEKDLESYKKIIASLQQEIDQHKKAIKEKKAASDKINQEIEQKGEKKQVAMHKEIEGIRVQVGIDKQRIADLKRECEKIDERKTQLEATLKELEEKIGGIDKNKHELDRQIASREKDIQTIEKRLETFKKKHHLEDQDELSINMEKLDQDADVLQEEINKLREQQQNLLREKDKVDMLLQNIDDKIAKVSGAQKENKAKFEQLKQEKSRFRQLSMELNSLTTEDKSLSVQLENARNKYDTKNQELRKREAQSIGMKEGISGSYAITKILDQKKNIPGIHGQVSDLGSVKRQYALALEVAAGGRIKGIVVDDDKVAAKCIKYLKEKRFGVATFLPLNKIRSANPKSELKKLKGKGIHGLAVDLVSYDKKYNNVFHYVFENTLVVENVETARRLGIGTHRMVTLEGDTVEKSGAMQGGYRKKVSGRGFKEKELTEGINQLSKEVEDLHNLIVTLQSRRSDNEKKITDMREEKANLEADIIKLEKILHLDSDEVGINKKEKEKLKKEETELARKVDDVIGKVSEKNKALAHLKVQKQQLRDKINQLRKPTLIAELNTFEEKKEQLKEEVSNLKGERKHSDSEISNILEPERQNIDKILKQHLKESQSFKDEEKALITKIKQQEKELKEKEAIEKKFYGQFKDLFNKRTKLNEEVVKLEEQTIAKEDKIREQENKSNLVNIEKAKHKAELAGLEEDYQKYEGIELFESKDKSVIEKEIKQFEHMQEGIGAVNMRALEIYERVEKEYHELIEKKGTLQKEREDVLVMINEIDSKKKELFMVTFEEISKNFKSIFSALSTKGDAFLELENKKDPFDGGMRIKVRISGKKFLDIRSLSGGEKTLTALAFIFAVQEYEPAPFYVLDEVDAALDKRNSEKLAKLVKSYAKKAQYLMISHNDYVISEANNLYGVSMNEHGMSKVTTLKL